MPARAPSRRCLGVPVSRIRTIKPEFWADEKLAPLDPATRLVFLGLISMADDTGRLLDNLKKIDAFIYPFSEDSAAASLDTLTALGRLRRGWTENGQRVIEIVGFLRHQKIDRPNYRGCLPPLLDDGATTSETFDEASTKPRRSLDEASTKPRRTIPVSVSVPVPVSGSEPAAAAADFSSQPPLRADYLTACVQALNAGLAENQQLPGYRQVSASEQAGTVTWEAEGIPLDIATRTIRRVASKYRPKGQNRQPSSLRYFDAAVREAHTGERRGSGTVSPPYHQKYKDPYAPPRTRDDGITTVAQLLARIAPTHETAA